VSDQLARNTVAGSEARVDCTGGKGKLPILQWFENRQYSRMDLQISIWVCLPFL
jgi:hypothetical protein